MEFDQNQFRADLLEAIESGVGTDWTWDDDDLEEYEVPTFDSNWALSQVLEVLQKYGIYHEV
ncbi:hypothetical protein [Leptospira johnsonii]|uniref:Uncharacterized protein n=1 Tax=Leptospira johnsonii TaxID=1917820 RepID=A0A2P2D7T6_9LEPT|nr:hypothetical protein [Leptospira johnsonii]GBF40699.1 hypothetical protein LPTSP1_37170 [Leptospira johnsonii]